MKNYYLPKERGLFDRIDRIDDLRELGDPLARLDEVMDWSLFEPVLASLARPEPRGPGGRPAFPPLMMLKALVIQNLYGLSDRQLQFQITDRASFKRFLGMTDADRAPDEKTVWAFREALGKAGVFKRLFEQFGAELRRRGLIANRGQLVDATFVEVPRQRNSREENALVKAGEIPEGWKEKPAKARQKDTHARWTKKHGRNYFGYKNHVKADLRSKLITAYEVTSASVHDSQVLGDLVRKGDSTTYADSAYAGEACAEIFKKRKVEAKIIDRGWRNRPLNGTQKRVNKARSRRRARVEHIFGAMRMWVGAAVSRCVGLVRTRWAVGMTNLVYNIARFEQIERLGLKNWRAA